MFERIMLSFGLSCWAIIAWAALVLAPEPAMAASALVVAPPWHAGVAYAAVFLLATIFGWSARGACGPLITRECDACGACHVLPHHAGPNWRGVAIIAALVVAVLAGLMVTAKAATPFPPTILPAVLPLVRPDAADFAEMALAALITIGALSAMLLGFSAGYLVGLRRAARKRVRATPAEDPANSDTEAQMRAIAAGVRRHT